MSILDKIKKAFTKPHEQTEQATSDTHETPATPFAADIYVAALEGERRMKDQFFRMDPHSPIEDRVNFEGLDYYEPNPDYRYTLMLQPAETREELTFQTSTGDEQLYYRLGTVEFEVEGQTAQLAVYQSTDHQGLFVPFRDATSGEETYGAGRYLEPEQLSDNKLLLDFNLAYNPYCAYSEDYSCPLPPFENHLTTIAIRAGEKAYEQHDPDLNQATHL